jgi:phage shock protein PspC (stress-responsive transcriptional regulator)
MQPVLSGRNQPYFDTMNKILNINLGGYAITIDDDAYEFLSAYLDNIRNRFSESEGRDEIVHDIEMRLGELIHTSMGNRTIVMLPDVQAAVQVMGQPEDFGGEPAATSNKSKRSSSRPSSIQTGKRLFRDEEDTVVAGICSGLSAYVGMGDPVWMRLIFVLLTFLSAGFWIPAYLLLWILVPPARSAADRLAMRGEPANVDNIAREIEEGFERLSNKVNEFGSGNKKKGGSSGNAAISAGVAAIGQIFAFVLRFLARFGIAIGIVVAVAVFLSFALVWVVSIFGIFTAAPYLEYFSPYSTTTTWLGFTNIFFLVSIPLLGLCLTFTRALFKVRPPGWLSAFLGIFWSINLVLAFILGGSAAKEYWQGGFIKERIDLSSLNSDTLHIAASDLQYDEGNTHWWGIHSEGVNIDDMQLRIKGLSTILVKQADGAAFECNKTVRSRGSSILNAEENASMVDFAPTMQGNTLKVPLGLVISKGKKWRAQEVKLEINVPVGKYVIFGDGIFEFARSNEYGDEGDGPYIREYPNRLFVMTTKGLVCVDCPKLGESGYHGNTDFENFIIEGNLDAEIRESDDFKFKIEGSVTDRNLVQVIRTGDKITFTTNGAVPVGNLRILIEAPRFTSLFTNGRGNVVLRGFDEGSAKITARGGTQIKAYLDVNDFTLLLSDKAKLDLTGDGNDLHVSLSDGAILEASTWRANNAEISANTSSTAHLNVVDRATVKADASSIVKVEGTANIEQRDNQ